MLQSSRNRRNRNVRPGVVAAMAEVVEPRTLLSAVSESAIFASSGSEILTAVPATKEVTVEARLYSTHSPYTLRIDEIRLVGDEIQVFSTQTSPPLDGGVGATIIDIRRSQTVTVPNRELTVVYLYADLKSPQPGLYFLRESGTSSLLYRNPLADTSTAWPIVDLGFTETPAPPTGLTARVGEVVAGVTTPSRKVTLYFDEQLSASSPSERRYVNCYEVRFKPLNGMVFNADEFVNFGSYHSGPPVALMDTTTFSLTGAGGSSRIFHGRMETTSTMGSHAFQVRVQKLPVFPEGTTGTNAFASPWSDWSDTQTYTVLPANEQILMRAPGVLAETGETTIGWSIVENAESYQIWIEQAGKPVLRKAGLTGTHFRLDTFLGTGEFKAWVKAVRADGTTTGWSKPVSYTVAMPTVRFNNLFNPIQPGNLAHTHVAWHDKTPTLKWNGNSLATQYQFSVIDLDKEEATITMRFASAQDRVNFITAYTRTLPGSATEHTVETPLSAGRYRVELQMQLGSEESVSTSGLVNLEAVDSAVAFLAPGSTNTVQWHRGNESYNYEIWIAYLGPAPGQTVVSRQPGKWQFDRVENLSSTYRFADDAPGGKYRVWVRPRAYDATRNPALNYVPQTKDGPWGPPADITLQDPLLRSASPVVRGPNGRLTWSPIPRAQGYEVVVWMHNPLADEVDRLPSSPYNERFHSDQAQFQLPYHLMARFSRVQGNAREPFGSCTVWIRPLYASLNSITQYSERATVQFHLQPGFTRQGNVIRWTAVPDAVRYQVQIRRTNSTEILVETTVDSPSVQTSPDLHPGNYTVSVTPVRRTGGQDELVAPVSFEFGVAFPKPTGLHVDGTIVAWNPVENATGYLVTVETIGGDMVSQHLASDASDPVPDFFVVSSNRTSRFGFYTTSTSFDLAQRVLATYRNAASLHFRVKVQVGSSSPSESIEFAPSSIPAFSLFAPTIESSPQPKPAAPTLGAHLLGNGRMLRLHSFEQSLSGGARAVIYRAEHGTLLDLEHVGRFQLRVMNLKTGKVTVFDESQIPVLMQFYDAQEAPFPPTVDSLGSGPISTQSLVDPFSIPGLSTGVYRIEARVQYLPVILQATQNLFDLPGSEGVPDHINVAATPWSDWSYSIDYAVMPAGENILPWTKSAQTTDARPTFGWGSNAENALYELWVENRVTKERVIRKTLSNVKEFKPTADLPPGQYDWWVRIVGTEGARKGWSPKQSLEIFAPAVSSTVVAETVDATPVVSWTAASNAQSYRIQVTSTTTRRVVYQATEASSHNSHRVAVTLPNDTYTVSIQALLPNGGYTAPGAVNAEGGFNIPKMIIGAAPKGVIVVPGRVTWNAVNGATRYQVWINFVDRETAKPQRLLINDSLGTELAVSPDLFQRIGEYRVWVRAIRNEAGHESTGRWSEQANFITGLFGLPNAEDSKLLAIVMSDLSASGILDTVA